MSPNPGLAQEIVSASKQYLRGSGACLLSRSLYSCLYSLCTFLPSRALSSAMATDFPMHALVRPGMLDWTSQALVDTETLWKVFVGSSLLVTKRLFLRWRAYRQQCLPIQGTPSGAESLSEMDSPDSRFDGAFAAAITAAATTAEAAAVVAEVQEGQVFLQEGKIREKKFEEKIAQFKQEMERMKMGIDTRDQQKNKQMQAMREEIGRQQEIIFEQNKV